MNGNFYTLTTDAVASMIEHSKPEHESLLNSEGTNERRKAPTGEKKTGTKQPADETAARH